MEKWALYEIIKAGVQAPSGGNTQPWIIKPLENYDSFILLAPEYEPDFSMWRIPQHLLLVELFWKMLD